MDLIRKLGVGLSLVPLGFDDVGKPISGLKAIEEQAARTQDMLAEVHPSKQTSATSSGSSGPDMGAVLSASMAPLANVVGNFGKQFDQLAGTLTTLAQRIDSAMKFPQTMAALDALRAKIRTSVEKGTSESAESTTRFQRLINNFGPVVEKSIGVFQGFLKVKDWISSLGPVTARTQSQIMGMNFSGPIGSAIRFSSVVTGPVQGSVKSLHGGVKSLGLQIGAAFGIFGLAYTAVDFLKKGIKGASDFNETLNKTEVILGKGTAGTKAITDEANKLSTAYGVAKNEYIGAATNFAAAFKVAGTSAEKAAEMGNKLAKLGLDFGSQDNYSNAEAFQAIQAALRGSMEPIEKFNIALNMQRVEAEAARMGLTKVGGQYSDLSKKTAITSLIFKQSSDKLGDLENTASGAANQFRKAGGGVANFGVAIGQVLLPSVTKVASGFNTAMGLIIGSFEANKDRIQGAMEATENAVAVAYRDIIAPSIDLGRQAFQYFAEEVSQDGNQVGGVLNSIGGFFTGAYDVITFSLRNLGDIFKVSALMATETLTNWGIQIETFGKNVVVMASYIGKNWYELIYDGLNAARFAYVNWVTNVLSLVKSAWSAISNPTEGFKFEWTPLLQGFEATVKELPKLLKPELISLQSDIDSVLSNVGQKELARTLQIEADGKKKTIEVDDRIRPAKETKLDEIKPAEMKLAGVAKYGTAEAYSAIVKNQFGRPENSMKDVASNTKEGNQISREGVTELKKISGMAGTLSVASFGNG